MGEIMRPIPFDKALKWALAEYRERKTVFGLHESKFFRNETRYTVMDEEVGACVGPAAGPNSQLMQNIVAAVLAGGRFVELKTVQTMDGEQLRKCIARPCINAADEGYNVEWSTELTVAEAMAEYIKAWLLLHVLMKELGVADKRDFAFNMSVGYSLDGICSPKIDGYIEGLKDARTTEIWKECRAYLADNIGLFERFTTADLDAISPAVARSVTLSTLHGCPSAEIERIAAHLITKKRLHTYIKCNPTLLGYETARGLLDEMGYGYMAFDTHHFENDLQFDDAVLMFKRLLPLAGVNGLWFGLKLSNTFPVKIRNNELPGEEMYMSGRALYPLTLTLAAKLAQAFGGKLPISFSGGADYFNIADILGAGIRPVTAATTLLKPGGYARLNQLAAVKAGSVIDCGALTRLAAEVTNNARHRKDYRAAASRKVPGRLGLYDCAIAPCSEGCPIGQRIPEYLKLISERDYTGAYAVIIKDNAAPAITGAICDHKCQGKCTRIDYDDSLRIRAMKALAAAEGAGLDVTPVPLKTDKRAVVIGGGPAGMAAALYLRRNGVSATVLEKRDKPYGIVAHVIPEFRIPHEAIASDLALAMKTGVELRCGVDAGYDIAGLKKEYDYIIIATGAWGRSRCGLEHGEERLLDAIEFLEAAKKAEPLVPQAARIAVIGGGDVAMDCARAAKRGGADAVVVYRRTKEYMPAEREELLLAEADGVEFLTLLSPVGYDGERLECDVMELAEYGADGRRKAVRTGERRTLRFDAVISATGAAVGTEGFVRNGIALDGAHPAHDANNETNIGSVFVAGDCRTGPATVVKALADAKRIARVILAREGLAEDFAPQAAAAGMAEARERKGILCESREDMTEGERCLACNTVCELCADVCPNRANIALADGQILHIDGMCNECGNCAWFCPYDESAPYRDKVTLFWNEDDFAASDNTGFIRLGADRFRVRREDKTVVECTAGAGELRGMIENTPQWCYCYCACADS